MTKDDPHQGMNRPNVPWDELEHQHYPNINHDALHQQLLCVGMKQAQRAVTEEKKNSNARVAKMEQILDTDNFQTMLNTKPQAYQEPVKMNKDAMSEHIKAGQDFDISFLLYEVEMCHCCGRVQPGHADPFFSVKDSLYTPPPFHHMSLVNQCHDAWLCTCNYCNGDQGGHHGQFWPALRHNILWHYRDVQDGEHPRDFLSLTSPNARICDKCYREVDVTKKDRSAATGPQTNKKNNIYLISFFAIPRHYFPHPAIPNTIASYRQLDRAM